MTTSDVPRWKSLIQSANLYFFWLVRSVFIEHYRNWFRFCQPAFQTRCSFELTLILALYDFYFIGKWSVPVRVFKILFVRGPPRFSFSKISLVRVRVRVRSLQGNRYSARVTSARNNFGTTLWTSAPNINFGTEFYWNVNFGIKRKDYVCRS